MTNLTELARYTDEEEGLAAIVTHCGDAISVTLRDTDVGETFGMAKRYPLDMEAEARSFAQALL